MYFKSIVYRLISKKYARPKSCVPIESVSAVVIKCLIIRPAYNRWVPCFLFCKSSLRGVCAARKPIGLPDQRVLGPNMKQTYEHYR